MARIERPAAEVVTAARSCIGARFRLHGRRPETGLDCVGLVALAYGWREVPSGYALRGGSAAAIMKWIDAAGLRRVQDDPPAGALLLLEAGPFQHHLAIRTDAGFVHADAGLRRVVETPGLPRWPLIAAWQPDPIHFGE